MKEPDEITPIEFTTNTRKCVLGMLAFIGLLIFGILLVTNIYLTPHVRSRMFFDVFFSLMAIMLLLILVWKIYGYIQALNTRPKMLLDTNGLSHTWITPSPIAWHLVQEAEIYLGEGHAWAPAGISLVLYRNHPPLTAGSSIVKIRLDSLFHDGWVVTIPTFMFTPEPKDITKVIKDRIALAKNRSV